jgi:signal transduction histidine kinase
VATGEGEVRFSNRDTGGGISPEHLPHLFERYWQGRQGESSGAGLGLYIARGIIEAHGGRIWADSTPGQGTVISFTLPSG